MVRKSTVCKAVTDAVTAFFVGYINNMCSYISWCYNVVHYDLIDKRQILLVDLYKVYITILKERTFVYTVKYEHMFF